ncbi:MAG TPA: 2,3-diaminopropionate biosynthesis protein SbnA [Pseudonocardiaceae bacterium]
MCADDILDLEDAESPGGILATVGNTPLVELVKLFPDFPGRLHAKLERFNPGGSIKDRSALGMLLGGIRSGELVPGRSVVVESSSGNLAIGLAQACNYVGLDFICVVDAKTTDQNLAVLRALRANVEVITEPDPQTGEYLPARLRRVRELVATVPHAYWPNQYANPLNAKAHQRTMREIARALRGRVDYLFCAAGSGGTLRGCTDYIRAAGLSTTVIAVDAVGSAIFGDQRSVPRLIPGHGSSIRPALLDRTVPDEVVHVTDLDCVLGCRMLVNRESILAGGSSGAVIAAVERVRHRIPDGASCAVILPDGGDRYLDTIYSDTWVRTHFGAVPRLWDDLSAKEVVV